MTKLMRMTVLFKRMFSMQRTYSFRIFFPNDVTFKTTTQRRKYRTEDVTMMGLEEPESCTYQLDDMGKSLVANNNNNSYYYLNTAHDKLDILQAIQSMSFI